MKKKKFKSIEQLLKYTKIHVSRQLHEIGSLLSRLGSSEHTAMLIICTLPENEKNNSVDCMIGFEGSSKAIAKAIFDQAKKDENFKQFMIDVMFTMNIDEEKVAEAKEKVAAHADDQPEEATIKQLNPDK